MRFPSLHAMRPEDQRAWTGLALRLAFFAYAATTLTTAWTRGSAVAMSGTGPFMLAILATGLLLHHLGARILPIGLLIASVTVEVGFTFATSTNGIRTSSSLVIAPLVVGTTILWGSRAGIVLAGLFTVGVPTVLLLPGGPGIPLRDVSTVVVVFVSLWTVLGLVLQFQRLLGRTSSRLEGSRRRLSSLIENVPTPIMVLDPSGRVEAQSASARRAFGPLEGQPVPDARRGHRPVVDREGKVQHLEPFFFEITNEDGEPQRMVAFQDVSDRVLAEHRREEVRRHLEESRRMEAIGRFGEEFVHNLNNVLQVLIGRTDLLDADTEELRAFKEVHLDELRGAAALVTRLQDSLRAPPATRRLVPLGRLLGDLEPFLRALSGDEVALRFRSSPDCDLDVDKSAVESALRILIQNAVEASAPGGVVEVSCRGGDGTVQLEVRDEGRGMGHEVLARAFEPFFTTKGEGARAGLGLPTLRTLVRATNGRLELASREGEGTSALITWPAPSLDQPEAADTPTRRILIVDDDEAMRRRISVLLRRSPYETETAGSASEALRRLAEADPGFDLVLTDVFMAEASGLELARRLEAEQPNLPVLFMTGYGEDLLSKESDLQLDRVLMKPFGRQTLLARIEELLGPSKRIGARNEAESSVS